MSNISVVTKNTGDQHTAAELNEQTGWINSPSKALGAWSPLTTTLDSSGNYNSYAISGNLIITTTGTPVEGNWQKVRLTGFNGTFTITVPETSVILNNSFANGSAPGSGTYDLWMAYIGGEYLYNLVEVTIIEVTLPVFSNVSVNNISDIDADFNAQTDLATTIYWGVWPSATSQRTKTQIAAGTGALDFGTRLTGGGSIESIPIDGLTISTAYKVHYYAAATVGGNESDASITSEFSTQVAYSSQIETDMTANGIHISARKNRAWTLSGINIITIPSINLGGALTGGLYTGDNKPSLNKSTQAINFVKEDSEILNNTTVAANYAGAQPAFSFAFLVQSTDLDTTFQHLIQMTDADALFTRPRTGILIGGASEHFFFQKRADNPASGSDVTHEYTGASWDTNYNILVGYSDGSSLTVYWNATKIFDAVAISTAPDDNTDIDAISIGGNSLNAITNGGSIAFMSMNLKEFALLDSNIGDARAQAWRDDLNNIYSVY